MHKPATTDPVRLCAPAKLNLSLAVDRPRESDGLHPILSWMVPISLHDDVSVTASAGESSYDVRWLPSAVGPNTAGAIGWPLKDDLAVRAHKLLETTVGRPLPVELRVGKRIAAGAGLGGGSSDAAAVLVGVRTAYGLDIDDASLTKLAFTLGADVPFFVRPRPTDPVTPKVLSGVGDRLRASPMPRLRGADQTPWAVLAVPSFCCPTGPVYQAFDGQPAPEQPWDARTMRIRLCAQDGAFNERDLSNDLAPAAEAHSPPLGAFRTAVAHAAGVERILVHVTGSGSACFVLCPDGEASARTAAKAVSDTPGATALAVSLA